MSPVRPGVIPQRGAEADAFFKHMIKKYYTIKADTTITAIENNQHAAQTTADAPAKKYITHDGASSVHWACFNNVGAS